MSILYMYVSVCMHVCMLMYVYMYVHIHVCTYVCMLVAFQYQEVRSIHDTLVSGCN